MFIGVFGYLCNKVCVRSNLEMTSIRTISLLIASIAIFFAGWSANGWRWSAKWSEFEAQAAHEALEEAQKSQTIESSWRELADMAAQHTKEDYEEINQKYQMALARIDDLGLELDRLHEQRSDSAGQMPSVAKPAAGACKPCACQSHRADAKGIAEALTIAKDCDRLAVRYNRLLELYNSVRQK